MNAPDSEDPREKKSSTMVDALVDVLESLPTIAAILLAFVTFAHAIGTIRAQFYYLVFDARWMVSYLSAQEIILGSIPPISLVAAFVVLLWIFHKEFNRHGRIWNSISSFLNSFKLSDICAACCFSLVIVVIAFWLLKNGPSSERAVTLFEIANIFLAGTAGVVFRCILNEILSGHFAENPNNTILVMAYLFLSAAVSALSGFTAGIAAADPARSQLPVVETDASGYFRLLHVSEGIAWSADLGNGEKGTYIYAVPVSGVKAIHNYRWLPQESSNSNI
jgi:hypothetical protein